MTIEQLRKIHQSQPFGPFSLHMAGGRALHVPHPELLSHSVSGRTVIVFPEDEDFSVVDLLLVTELEIHRGQAPDRQPS